MTTFLILWFYCSRWRHAIYVDLSNKLIDQVKKLNINMGRQVKLHICMASQVDGYTNIWVDAGQNGTSF